MYFNNSFCTLAEALMLLLLLLGLSECSHMKTRNALLIVGSTSHFSSPANLANRLIPRLSLTTKTTKLHCS